MYPCKECSNGHILCIIFSLIILFKNLEEMGCLEKMREGAGAQETLGSYLWLEASLYRSNTGTKRMDLSRMSASKCWCLCLAPLHLNRKKSRVSRLRCRVKYINAARKKIWVFYWMTNGIGISVVFVIENGKSYRGLIISRKDTGGNSSLLLHARWFQLLGTLWKM